MLKNLQINRRDNNAIVHTRNDASIVTAIAIAIQTNNHQHIVLSSCLTNQCDEQQTCHAMPCHHTYSVIHVQCATLLAKVAVSAVNRAGSKIECVSLNV